MFLEHRPRIFEALRRAQSTLSHAKSVIEYLNHAPNPPAAKLKHAYDECAPYLTFAPKVKEIYTCSAIYQSASEERFEKCAELLDSGRDVEMGVRSLSPEVLEDIQSKAVTKIIIDALRTTGSTPGATSSETTALRQLRGFVGAIRGITFAKALVGTLLPDIENLHLLLSAGVGKYTKEEDFSKVERARKELLSNKAGPFFRALTLFSTGMLVVENASKAIQQAAKGRSCLQQVEDISKLVPNITVPSAENCVVDGNIVIPNHQEWVSLQKQVVAIKAIASSAFVLEHAGVLETKVNELHLKLASELFQALIAEASQQFGPASDSSIIVLAGGDSAKSKASEVFQFHESGFKDMWQWSCRDIGAQFEDSLPEGYLSPLKAVANIVNQIARGFTSLSQGLADFALDKDCCAVALVPQIAATLLDPLHKLSVQDSESSGPLALKMKDLTGAEALFSVVVSCVCRRVVQDFAQFKQYWQYFVAFASVHQSSTPKDPSAILAKIPKASSVPAQIELFDFSCMLYDHFLQFWPPAMLCRGRITERLQLATCLYCPNQTKLRIKRRS